MATLTIRNVDDALKERLRVRAATHGHSMEEEVRVILKQAMDGMTGGALWQLSRDLFGEGKGTDLQPSLHESDRAAPDFGGSDYDDGPSDKP